ncbi:hypothetical protein Tco_0252546 [Tanacetum coccineum]
MPTNSTTIPTTSTIRSRGVVVTQETLQRKKTREREKKPEITHTSWSQVEELVLAEEKRKPKKWTIINREVRKYNTIVNQTVRLSGEDDEDLKTRVELLYHDKEGKSFPQIKAWNFLKDKHKWLNPDPPHARRSRRRPTGEEPELFGDDVLSRSPDKDRKSKDRGTNMKEIRNEAKAWVQLINTQTRNEDMKMLAVNTERMDPIDTAIIEEAKHEIRAKY